jgi:uncharacterized membrane protein YgdD (TMEM256/DUF423 family)
VDAVWAHAVLIRGRIGDHVSPRTWIIAGAIFGALSVCTGAFGAHALKGKFEPPELADTYEIAVRYQMYHALALVLVGLIGLHSASVWLNAAGGCFVGGILIFSGLLYAYALGGPKILGAIVPIGGLAMIIGLVLLAIAALGIAKR